MMPPIVLTLLQGLFLLLLYVFVARAVRAVLRDVSTASAPRPAPSPAPAATTKRSKAPRAPQRREAAPSRERTEPKRTPPGELVVHLANDRPKVMPLDGTDITFGRSPEATVQLSDPYTSDQHARVHHDGSRWVITDLGSTNGTFVNQVKVTAPTPIAAGDQLGIGRTVVEVRK